MNKQIAKFEQNKNWQATAQRKNGQQVAVMSGQPGGEFEGKFYLYDADWFPAHPAVGMPSYSGDEIHSMFASGELSLLRGSIPK